MPFARAAFRCSILLVLFAAAASASDIGNEIANQVSLTNYQHYLADLLYTHDGNNRDALSGPDHAPARDNIVATLTGFGLDVQVESFSYSGTTCYNVIATQQGTVHPNACFIIGAHYDSAGTPGADDNASGVAGFMEIARILSTYESEYTIKYIAFDTEEYGLLGSQAYVNAHFSDDIRGMISMDMIAHDNGSHSSQISGFAACLTIKSALLNALTMYGDGLGATLVNETSSRSDHGPFQAAGFQACMLIEASPDSNPCYHHACDSVDTAAYIDDAFAVKMTRSVAGYLADNAGAQWPFDCSTMAGCDPADHGGEDCNANGVWDQCDIVCGPSADVNGNGIPDECEPHETWYVDAANCPGDGSQANPFCTIQTAINAAASGLNLVVEIIVADGVYTGSGNKDLDFGGKSINLHSANGPVNCIIDCQANGRGFYFHSGETSAARVDGFTIRNGNVTSSSPGDANGGGVYCSGSSPTLTRCTISGSTASSGGGMCFYLSNPTLTHCTISGNTGRGVYCYRSSPTLTDCTISGNMVTGSIGYGGGAYCTGSVPTLNNCTISGNTAASGGGLCCDYSNPRLTGCTISGNTASGSNAGYGGGLYCTSSAAPTLFNCVINRNRAYTSGGGVYCTTASNATFSHCTITENTARGNTSNSGGGVYCSSASPMLTNCSINANTASGTTYGYGGGVYCFNSSPTLTNCTMNANAVSGTTSSYGGGAYCNYSSNLNLTNCSINGNTATSSGGGMYCSSSSPRLTDCTISRNNALSGGGIYCNSSSNPNLTNCSIDGNTAFSSGGGLLCSSSSPTLVNCAVSRNLASSGAGAYCSSSNPTLTNCAISGNRASSSGGGVYCATSFGPVLTNCILWGDSPQEISTSSGAPIVAYCDVQGGYAGTANINADPGAGFADDFHLTAGSPCIDAGTNTPAGGLPGHDADGNLRPLDGNGDGQALADIGAYEFNPTAPSLALSPQTFEIFACAGDPSPKAQQLSIRNRGSGVMTWDASTDCSWLSVEPSSGSCQQNADLVNLSIDATSLAAGDYFYLLTVSAPQAPNSPRSIPVTLHVGAPRRVPSNYATIQAAIDAAAAYDWVLVADGVYTGTGNKDLDFHGKAITVRSESGNAAACIIDCQGSGRGFYFHTRETAVSVVDGFTIRNGLVTSNSIGSDYGGGVLCTGASPTLSNCTIIENSAYSGGGAYCSSSSPTLNNCSISGNTTSASGGGMCCSNASSPTLSDCTITANVASNSGGGMSCDSSSPTLANCAINGNRAAGTGSYSGRGGALFCNSSNPRLANCTVIANTASSVSYSAFGGGLYCYMSSPMLTNCSISANKAAGAAPSDGGGLYCSSSNPTLTNCILWADSPQEIYLYGGSTVVTYSDIQGGWTGTGNLNTDPLFLDPANGNFHLAANSPCIDVGSNAAVPPDITTDIDGDPRILRGHPLHITVPRPGQPLPPPPPPPTVDIGADEFRLVIPEVEAIPIGPPSPAPPPGVRRR